MDSELPVSVKAAPSPKSPPKYPDFCGRRRLQLEVQVLNREIGFLEEELQSLEGLQPVSICCKDVEEFVGSKADPLIAIDNKRQSSCRFWKWLGSVFCFPISLLCCCCGGCPKSACCARRKNCGSCSCGCRCKEHCPICTCGCRPICTCFHLPSCLAVRRSCSSCCPCACGLSCCRLPRCRCSRCCCRSRPAELACCGLPPQCPASCWDRSSCMPWRWPCGRWCCSCQGVSCSFPKPSCPVCSCGCIWSCSKCAQAGPCCRTCGSPNSSCSSGCLC